MVTDRLKRSLVLALAFTLAALAGRATAGDKQGASPYSLDSDEYPIGIYSVMATDEHFAKVKAAGFGYVHTYGLARDDTPEALKRCIDYLDLAEKHDLKVMVDLFGRHWVPMGEEGIERLRGIVQHLKDHPALGFWYLCDEPDPRFPPEDMVPFYEMIKAETPNIPVAIAQAWTENWADYGDGYDILMPDNYPVYNEPFPEAMVQHLTTFTENAISLGKPVFPVLQSFNWAGAGPTPDAKVVRGRDASTLRYPEQREIRYWLYATRLQGARGVFFWSYYRSLQTGSEWFDGPFTEAVQEFRDFSDLVRDAKQSVVYQRAEDDNLHIASYRFPDKQLLVLVNAWPLERQVVRRVEVPAGVSLTPWGLTRTEAEASVDNGMLKADVEPWEVLIWEVTKSPSPDKGEEN